MFKKNEKILHELKKKIQFPSKEQIKKLSEFTCLNEKQIKKWFTIYNYL